MVNAEVLEPNVFIHMEHLLMVVLEPDRMIDQYNIKGSLGVYTIVVNSCRLAARLVIGSLTYSVYIDMTRECVAPVEIFL